MDIFFVPTLAVTTNHLGNLHIKDMAYLKQECNIFTHKLRENDGQGLFK